MSLEDSHDLKRKFSQDDLSSPNTEKKKKKLPKPVPQEVETPKAGIKIFQSFDDENDVFEDIKDSSINNKSISQPNYQSLKIHWDQPPKNILITKKKHDDEVNEKFEEIIKYFQEEKKCTVYVDPYVYEQEDYDHVETYREEDHPILHKIIDLVIVLGGDGTILHVSSQFPNAVPPILAFSMGSLGFLTSFDISNYKETVEKVFKEQMYMTLRNRLSCKIIRKDGKEEEPYQVLNELVIDRGLSPFLTGIDCFISNKFITQIQADGLIISTPTGSTAYSMSAGGSMVHPSVNGILLTPICPHSLSFRPLILPNSIVLHLKINENARATAYCSFDGRGRQELMRGDKIEIKISHWPLPNITKTDQTSEWFLGLSKLLHWNLRETQKPIKNHSEQRMNFM